MAADTRGCASFTTGEGSKVLIIGAGCTGLALAHGLKKVPKVVAGYPDLSLMFKTGRDPLYRVRE